MSEKMILVNFNSDYEDLIDIATEFPHLLDSNRANPAFCSARLCATGNQRPEQAHIIQHFTRLCTRKGHNDDDVGAEGRVVQE
jgi:hypothetical protein